MHHLRATWLPSANSRFWGREHATSKMRSATSLIKTRPRSTFILRSPKLLRSQLRWQAAKAHHRVRFSAWHLWQAALNSLWLCLRPALPIYQTYDPQPNWQLQFFLSGSIMLSNDKWGNPKMGQVMNSRGRDALPENRFKEWEREWERHRAWQEWRRLVIHANEMYQGTDIWSGRQGRLIWLFLFKSFSDAIGQGSLVTKILSWGK